MNWLRAQEQDGKTLIPCNWVYLHYYEAFSVLFRVENALRLLAYVVLKDNLGEKWAGVQIADDNNESESIAAVAKRRRSQDENFGYLAYPVTCPLVHLTGGELARVMLSDKLWGYFKRFFPASKELVRTKLEEISNVRNSLAHFRPIGEGDVEVVKQNASQMLKIMEKTFWELGSLTHVVPTNTDEDWYKALAVLDSPSIKVRITQSEDTTWIGVYLDYNCPVVSSKGTGTYVTSRVLTLLSPGILTEFPNIRNRIIYLSEPFSFGYIGEQREPLYRKSLNLAFSRRCVRELGAVLAEEIKCLLLKIEEETELIRQDNLAQGVLVKAVVSGARLRKSEKGESWWSVDTDRLKCPVTRNDPPEYWGDFSTTSESADLVSDISRYPWMPVKVSEEEIPF